MRSAFLPLFAATLALFSPSAAFNTLTADATITASDAADADSFGRCASLSGDNLIIGAHGEDGGGSGSGAVYFFKRSGSTFVEKTKIAGASSSAQLGFTCSMDGTFAASGAQGDGYAEVYQTTDSGENWSTLLTINGPTGGEFFGCSVSLSGNHLGVGAYLANPNSNNNAGVVYVYTTSDSWATEPTPVTVEASDQAASQLFGRVLSLDSNLLAVYATLSTSAGQVYIYKTSDAGASWVEQQILTEGTPVNFHYFGDALSINAAAGRVVIGARGSSGNTGSVFVFDTADGGATWTEEHELVPTGVVGGDAIGTAVTTDGDRIAATTFSNPASYLFETSDGGASWTEVDKLPSAGANELYSVTMEADTIVQGTTDGNGFAEVFTPTNPVSAGGGGDPVIVDLHGHKFLAGNKPETEYLLWAAPDNAQKISFMTSGVRGANHGHFIHAVRVSKVGCGEVVLTADDNNLATMVEYTEEMDNCIQEQMMAGDSGLVATTVADGTVVFVMPHKSSGFSFLNVKFFGMTDTFKAGCRGMLCDESHADIEV